MASTLSREGLDLPGGRLGRAVRALGAPDPTDDGWRAGVATSVTHLQDLERAAGTVLDRTSASGSNELAKQLATVATLIESRVPTRVYSVSLGGFDTHAGERRTQEKLLGRPRTAATAPTTAPPGGCSCSATRSVAGSTAISRRSPTSTPAT